MISIIVPVYNVRPYLEQCIRSIIAQTYHEWECILVDDGSKDGSGELCDKLVLEDKRLIVIHQDNQGVSVARNKGIDISKGDFICFIDSDDWVEADYLSHLLSGMNENEIDMVVTGAIHETSKPKVHAPQEKYKLKMESEYTRVFIDHVGLFYGPCSILFKSSIIRSNNIVFPKDLSFGEDTTFVFSYLRKVSDIVLTPFYDYHYRIQDTGSLSYRFGENKTLLRYDLWKMRKAFYLDHDMWNTISQENMYKELWGLLYDGIFSTGFTSIKIIKKLLSVDEIDDLKNYPSLFPAPNWIKNNILHRNYFILYLISLLR